ncbi:MAG TPA: tRNA (adenosine(37)-N6)-dimethylallyltransferase MiaA [Candidatus Dormibacteraeota bacterium]|nr:tRNA (adenosine(37)-N6)-dimethylallyltransferase MiaA [Candidatus Dormibacteraeota bacterium]
MSAPSASTPLPALLLCLIGPTAVGKSEVALLLAERLGGEIISVDSMQVYRGLDLGTAKPTAEERARVAHHLIDICEVAQPFDAAQFVTLARQAIDQIHARRRLAILCGGTGLYFKALLYGLGTGPPTVPALRRELEKIPLPELLRELAARDPQTHERIDRQNPRRVIRALEILRQSPSPLDVQRADWTSSAVANAVASSARVFALTRPLAELYRRIDARVDQMFRNGLEAETRGLLARAPALSLSATACQAIGYRQVIEYLRGQRPLEETVALVKQRTRQFARRQLTWLRHQLPVEWIPWPAGESATEVAAAIEELFRKPVTKVSASTTT